MDWDVVQRPETGEPAAVTREEIVEHANADHPVREATKRPAASQVR